MLTTVNKLKEATKEDVGIYHHVDACVTLLGPVPEGIVIGQPAYAEDGSALLLRGIAYAEAPSVEYELKFKKIDTVLLEPPAPKKKATKQPAKKVEEDMPEVDDTDVDSMT